MLLYESKSEDSEMASNYRRIALGSNMWLEEFMEESNVGKMVTC